MPQIHKAPLTTAYDQWLSQGHISSDPLQAEIIEHCALLQTKLMQWYEQVKSPWRSVLKFLFPLPNPPKGIYIFGEVGRGKSMIMDLFYQTMPNIPKRRVHFHAFMQEIHGYLGEWRKKYPYHADPIPSIAKIISQKISLLCFDEFHVHDIADAMIIERLFTALFKQNVVMVATSNVAPENLYQDGLQRENFLPFIAVLRKYTVAYALLSSQDYRLRHLLHINTVYNTPLGVEANKRLQRNFSELTNGATPEICILTIHGRKVTLPHTHGDIALCEFNMLCGQPLGAADYIEIARHFSTLIIANIPLFDAENTNEAKRFIMLIDELYEHKTKLICSAAAYPSQLCNNSRVAFEFKRTASRLTEMQSLEYLGRKRKI